MMMKPKNIKSTLENYGPGVGVVAEDYTLLISSKERIDKSKHDILAFLSKTNPDHLCEDFYDAIAKAEGEYIKSNLEKQYIAHLRTTNLISKNHHAELIRVDGEIKSLVELLSRIFEERKSLSEFYTSVNGKEI